MSEKVVAGYGNFSGNHQIYNIKSNLDSISFKMRTQRDTSFCGESLNLGVIYF